jgi:chromosome partitioning protein
MWSLSVQKPNRVPKICLLSSAKGGSGKTTSTRNLAVCAIHDGVSVATVDLDAQASLTLWYRRRPDEAPPLQHFQAPLAEAIEALDTISNIGDVDLILVDTPPGVETNPGVIKALIRKADYTLIPTGQGAPDIETVMDWARLIRREGGKSAFLLNRTARGKNSYSEAKLELSRIGALCPFDVRDLEDIQRTHRSGLGVVEVRGSMGAADFSGAWNFLRNELGLGEE